MDYFLNVTQNTNVKEYLKNLDKKSMLIYSPTSLHKLDINLTEPMIFNWHDISKRIDDINLFVKQYQDVDEIISFGGGSAIDIAKYISFVLNKKHTCIPSMLSTNAYATNKVALLVNGTKTTLNAKMPDTVLLDKTVLMESTEENLFGLADVLSIHTALYDWQISNHRIGENIDNRIFTMADELLQDVKRFIIRNSFHSIAKNVETLYRFIGEAGYITNLYGSGRPESGSEHIYAKELESIVDIPHGLSVSIGIVLMTMLQNRDEHEMVDLIKKIRVLDYSQKYHIKMCEVKRALFQLKPREDRYSIVNVQNDNLNLKEEIIQRFINKNLV